MAKKLTARAAAKPAPSTDEFVRVWEAASSVASAAAELGITPQNAHLRASYIRRSGIPLKMFKGGVPAKPKPASVLAQSAPERPAGPPVTVRGGDAFAAVWNAAASVAEAAAALGLTVTAASQQAAKFRRCGVKVKRFSTGPKPKPPVAPGRQPAPKRTPVRAPRSVAFAAVWNAAATVAEAAEQLKLTPRSAATVAAAYRREGVMLKKFETRPHAAARAAAFRAAWGAATTVEEVAERLGEPVSKVLERFRRMRQQGGDLKPLPLASARKAAQRLKDFAAQWNSARSVAELAAVLGLSRHALSCLACRLRKRGHQLKAFPTRQASNGSRADGSSKTGAGPGAEESPPNSHNRKEPRKDTRAHRLLDAADFAGARGRRKIRHT
ncbi:hypothetical protein R5W23_000119 [Gemmata sp. JC673]|uniref:Uncharacterized protein n=1 Tax=Gemmata algarum TaxID=2975278 RepID=A0ABU5ESH0_9BACT|nr:hypothetical protein [Gemmata algarum]MDY3557592.1 hypothetical protein [Gemmata algarum]